MTRPDRREFLIAGACAAALVAAEAFRPRKMLNLFRGRNLERTVPRSFANWTERPSSAVIAPSTPGSLADRLYSATLIREYVQQTAGPAVMLLIAYGGTQNDLLQLHRPESCYPAIGFSILGRRLIDLPISSRLSVPAVQMTAQLGDRTEDIIYWTRLGNEMPQTAAQQRHVRLSLAMKGYVGDGMLVRASVIRRGPEDRFGLIEEFLSDLISALPASDAPGFVGDHPIVNAPKT